MNNLNERFMKMNMNYVEAWFDNHPEPENIDMHIFTIDGRSIEVFFADMIYNTWMVKITCESATEALFLSNVLYKTTCQMNIEQILNNKKLFLFTDTRF